jgi:hypothetical protein
MQRRIYIAVLLAAICALLTACGGSSGISEEEATSMFGEMGIRQAVCIRSTSSNRQFYCEGERDEKNIRAKMLVSDDGTKGTITNCGQEKSEFNNADPCGEL